VTGDQIVIVDYGMGNLASIQNMLKYLGVKAAITNDAEQVRAAAKLILPGVGAFDSGMKNIEVLGLRAVLDDRVVGDGVPILGICLGMQLLGRKSEEGKSAGLGWIDADTARFRLDGELSKLKIPHMGWNRVEARKESGLLCEMHEQPRFYFVHSYHLVCGQEEDVLCITPYGYDFASAVERENIFGVQFHPEKSHTFGMTLLRNFAERV
jgi:glutamine amidotransferase